MIAQHDKKFLEATVSGLTGEAAQAGDTYLAFLATFTPVYSAGLDFTAFEDGFFELITTDCPTCGRVVSATTANPADAVPILMAIADGERKDLFGRLARRVFAKCSNCGNNNDVSVGESQYMF